MSKLKKSLLEKTEIEPSKNFDQVFFQKLEKERARPRVFATWITWLISGCATASVLFIALNTNNIQPHKFNHKEYVDSAMEFQSSFNEGITDDKTVDLTTFSSDEI